MEVLRVWIEGIPDNDNASRRKTWAVKMRERQESKRLAHYSALAAMLGGNVVPRSHLPIQKALLHVEFHFGPHRRHDMDNMWSCLKPYIDGMVTAGVIFDDDLDHLRGDLWEPVYGAKKPGVWFIFEER